MKDQVLLHKADFSCADYMESLITARIRLPAQAMFPWLGDWCSSDASVCIRAPNTATAPSMNFRFNCPFLYRTQDICTPRCGNMNRSFFFASIYSSTEIILFFPSFSWSSWKTAKSQINSPSQMRPLPVPHMQSGWFAPICSQQQVKFPYLSRCNRWSKSSVQRLLLPPSPPFLNMKAATTSSFQLQGQNCQVCTSWRVKDFSSLQEHHP